MKQKVAEFIIEQILLHVPHAASREDEIGEEQSNILLLCPGGQLEGE